MLIKYQSKSGILEAVNASEPMLLTVAGISNVVISLRVENAPAAISVTGKLSMYSGIFTSPEILLSDPMITMWSLYSRYFINSYTPSVYSSY